LRAQSRRRAYVFDNLIWRATSFSAMGFLQEFQNLHGFRTARNRYCVRSFGAAAEMAFWRVFFELDVLEDGIVRRWPPLVPS